MSWGASLNAKTLAAEAGKVLALGRREFIRMHAQIVNTAVAHTATGDEIPLFRLLDRGAEPHLIPDFPSSQNVLASAEGRTPSSKPLKHPIRGQQLHHPGIAPHDISGRAYIYFQNKLQQYFYNPSWTRSIAGRSATVLPFDMIRQAIFTVLRMTKNYAAQITPASWRSVKVSYHVVVNGKRQD
jgi:hypothetical protein